jgi:hypothetical protein
MKTKEKIANDMYDIDDMESLISTLEKEEVCSYFIAGKEMAYACLRQFGKWNDEYEKSNRPFSINMRVKLESRENTTGFKITFWIGSRNLSFIQQKYVLCSGCRRKLLKSKNYQVCGSCINKAVNKVIKKR